MRQSNLYTFMTAGKDTGKPWSSLVHLWNGHLWLLLWFKIQNHYETQNTFLSIQNISRLPTQNKVKQVNLKLNIQHIIKETLSQRKRDKTKKVQQRF